MGVTPSTKDGFCWPCCRFLVHCFVFLDYNSYLCAKFICLWQRAVSAPNKGGTICLACPPWAFKKGRAMMARRRNGQFGHRQIKMKR